MSIPLLIHIISTSIMCGVIWVVQLVHYPLFNFVRKEDFSQFEKSHCNRITLIVLPTMGVELLSGALLLYISQENLIYQINLFLLILIWLSNSLIQNRQHQKLSLGYNEKIHKNLVNFNWIRTILWSIRILLLFYIATNGS
jgi:hypothetical protein